MAFIVCVVLVPVALGPLREELFNMLVPHLQHTTFGRIDHITIILTIPVVLIAGAGAITLGVMLVKRIMGFLKK